MYQQCDGDWQYFDYSWSKWLDMPRYAHKRSLSSSTTIFSLWNPFNFFSSLDNTNLLSSRNYAQCSRYVPNDKSFDFGPDNQTFSTIHHHKLITITLLSPILHNNQLFCFINRSTAPTSNHQHNTHWQRCLLPLNRKFVPKNWNYSTPLSNIPLHCILQRDLLL